MYQPYVCPHSSSIVVGRSEGDRGIRDGKKVSEILHYLLATSMGPGSGEWFGRLVRTQTAEEKRTDMLMVGDFGNSPDGEKGPIMAVANPNPNPNPNPITLTLTLTLTLTRSDHGCGHAPHRAGGATSPNPNPNPEPEPSP